MNRLTLSVYKYCMDKGLLHDGIKLIAGISGGADSVCMLRILEEIKEIINLDIIAVHMEHGIRGAESLRDMEFVRSLCDELDIPLRIYKKDVPAMARQLSMTVEEAGRYLRYEAFDKELRENGADAIAVAHHLNDRAETVLFNMARGSGLKGMSGIAPLRDNVIRPLLNTSRAQIETYLKETGQAYCTDSTNSDTEYSRNGIRAIVLPELERIVTGASEHISRAADELREADEYISSMAAAVYERAVSDKSLFIDVLMEEPPVIRRYVVRLLLGRMYSTHKDLEAVHVDDVLGLCGKQSGRSVSLPKGVTARREGNRILFIGVPASGTGMCVSGESCDKEDICIQLDPDGITSVPGYGEFSAGMEKYDKTAEIPKEPYTKWFDYDKIVSGVFIRNRQSGDYLTIDPGEKKKMLKKYLIDEKIPLSERNSLIILADGSHIIWIPGYRISSHYKVGDDTTRILKVTFKPLNKDG